ncbi:MAG: metallophosphoesterase [Hyphomicrobiaceae bacterium]|nr:metallophosphoesterase [Hyphomicrobiaceae bacterium]
MTFRIAQISDTHLGAAKPDFVPGFAGVAAHVNASRPDLVVNSGDMSLDGAAVEDDLAEARRLHGLIEAPVRYLPGNHDLGEGADTPAPAGHPVVSEARRAVYVSHFGPDYWCLDAGGWRIVAINAQILGSGLPCADAQLRFVAETVGTAGATPVALLVHKPLFHLSADEDVVGGRFVNPGPRAELLKAFGGVTPTLVASGHVHQYFARRHQGSEHVWAPSTAFVIPDDKQPRYGTKEPGYVEHLLEADGTHVSRLVSVPGVARLDIADYMHVYAHYLKPQEAAETKPEGRA